MNKPVSQQDQTGSLARFVAMCGKKKKKNPKFSGCGLDKASKSSHNVESLVNA